MRQRGVECEEALGAAVCDSSRERNLRPRGTCVRHNPPGRPSLHAWLDPANELYIRVRTSDCTLIACSGGSGPQSFCTVCLASSTGAGFRKGLHCNLGCPASVLCRRKFVTLQQRERLVQLQSCCVHGRNFSFFSCSGFAQLKTGFHQTHKRSTGKPGRAPRAHR
jgi:hypothetical protein